jgi:hypothetical protein
MALVAGVRADTVGAAFGAGATAAVVNDQVVVASEALGVPVSRMAVAPPVRVAV